MLPKEIVEKMEQVNSLMMEIDKWMFENIETEGSKHQNTDFYEDFKHDDFYLYVELNICFFMLSKKKGFR